MKDNKIVQLQQGISTAFIDADISSNLAYKPQFISNNHKEGRKVLSSIENELLACEEFSISVAFITMSGITPLLQTLKELEKRNIPGRILTTNYLNFSEPKALKKLVELKNITLKMYSVDEAHEGFHTKGYIFKNEEIYRIIVGSSNMTLNALTKNREWNTKIVSTQQGEYAKEILEEFNGLWNSQAALDYKGMRSNFIKQRTEEIVEEINYMEYSYLALTDKEKAELFQFVPDDNNYNLELHMAVLKACGLKLDFDEVYEDYQKIYDKTMEMQGDKKNERGESGRGRAR